MDLPLNRNLPLVMHIDMNSCFATAEQQANPLLRGKPIAVAAYTTGNGCVIAPSIEAKRYGVRVGMTVREARLVCPQIIVRPPDPPKYRDIHLKFSRIFKEYSSDVFPKSIDEAVLDFTGMPLKNKTLQDVGSEIKKRIKREIGEWITVSVGISTNRFLAKLAASLKKPDGLETINWQNLEAVYDRVTLIDLCGINSRYQARLNARDIFTPLDFLKASRDLLLKQVFQSIVGHYWYLRLRGWEIDAVEFERKSFGQSYALGKFTSDRRELACLLMKLTEKMGRRLRRHGYTALGIHVSVIYTDYTHWHRGETFATEMYTTGDLFKKVMLVFNRQPEIKKVAKLAVSCFKLIEKTCIQEELFQTDKAKRHSLTDAADKINNRFGEFVITPALMLGMDDLVLDRIAFGGVKELEDLYASPINL